MHIIDGFVNWWNTLAAKNGKMKFRNQREAAEFVRRVHNQNGGPNDKIVALRKAYETANRERLARLERSARPVDHHHQAVL